MKILIAVPTFETIYPDTYKAIWDLGKSGNDVIFDFVRGYDCATARNAAALRAQNIGADILLMIDNDVTIPHDAIYNYLEDPKDVLLGSYAHRDTDNIYRGRTCLCKLEDENGKAYFNYPLESEYTAKELIDFENAGQTRVRIHGGGMGCAFIKTDIFNRIDYPWYDWVNYADDNRGMLSEDLYFCERCKSRGIEIYTDPRIRCGHMLRRIQEVE